MNRSSGDVEVSVDGTDDLGLRPGTTVRVVVPATDAVELTAAELGSGMADAIESGALGDGTGKWRLRVESDRIGAVLSLLSSPSAHLTNLSHADGSRSLGPLPAALLPAPETVTLESPGTRQVRGRWSAVEGVSYDVDLLRDGARGGPLADAGAEHDHVVPLVGPAGRHLRDPCVLGERGPPARPVPGVQRGGHRLCVPSARANALPRLS